MTNFKSLFVLLSFFLITSIGTAQTPDEQPSQFDLVIFGNNLDAKSTTVQLRENPGNENQWQKLESGQTISDGENNFTSILISNLSTEKFAGQDIRENYIAIKIRTEGSDGNQQIRAIYAVPHADYSTQDRQKMHAAIESDPGQIRKYSLANLVFPRVQTIPDGKEFTEHIEMPVRHLKPGVQEVKWLDIIFEN